MAADNFGLSDGDFWEDPLRDPGEGIPEEGLYLGAPQTVALRDHDTLPVVVRRSTSLKDSIVVPFGRYAVVHMVDLQSNRAWSRFALDQEGAIYPEMDAATLEQVVPAKTQEPFLIEGRERLGIQWRAADLLLTVTLRDKVSNRRRVKLGPGASAYQDPAVEEFLEKKKAKTAPPRPWPEPGDPLPAYVPADGSPKPPAEPGIALTVERVVEVGDDATCTVRGAFLLPVEKTDLVPADEGERHAAVVNVSLAITGADDAAPINLTVRVPIYGKVEAGKPAAGFFAFDLLSLVALPPKTQTYFLYAFSREVMAGPLPFALVADESLSQAAE
jgi:hypothetical protein